MIQVVPVETKKQQREFVKFPLKLYPKKSFYVPALYGDELKIFTDKCTYSDVAHHKCFIAYKDGKIAGRIQAIIQHQYNEIHNEKCCRFSRIHFINDLEVVKALFEAAENWAREQGMDTMRGPLNFSDLEREGGRALCARHHRDERGACHLGGIEPVAHPPAADTRAVCLLGRPSRHFVGGGQHRALRKRRLFCRYGDD